MNIGTSASPENLTCNKAVDIRRNPIAEEYNSLCAVDLGLVWHENKIIPTNTKLGRRPKTKFPRVKT